MAETVKNRKRSESSAQVGENITESAPQGDNVNEELAVAKRKRYTFEEKKNILEECKTLNSRELCAKYGLNKSVLSRWRSHEETIKNAAKTSSMKTLKKVSETNALDAELFTWLSECRRKGIPVSGPMLCRHALVINSRIGGPENFKASPGWLEKWKRRTDIKNLNITDGSTQERYLKTDAVSSCDPPLAGSEPETAATNSRNEDPMNMPKNSKNARDRVTSGSGLPKSSTINCTTNAMSHEDESDETSVATGWKIKEEPREPTIKLEPFDESYECSTVDARTTEKETGLDSSTVENQIEDTDVKPEFVDLLETDLSDHFRQIWDPSEDVGDTSAGRSTKLRSTTPQTVERNGTPKFTDTIGSNRDLIVLTGIPNFAVFNKIRDVLAVVSPRLINADGLKIDIADRIIMTFMKLKQDLSYAGLSAIFKCASKTSCKRMILRTLDSLGHGLKFAIRWPGTNEVVGTVPDCFRDLSKIRCVINRIEIAFRRPKQIFRRITSFSRYKRCHSVRLMTAVTTSGFVCFVSNAYGGRTSHENLFAGSDIVGSLEKDDAIAVFKDFPIDDVCRDNGIEIVKLHRGNDGTPAKYRETLNVNRRIRRYGIFRRRLTKTLAVRVERIVTILCAIENLKLLTSGNGTSNDSSCFHDHR